MSVRDRIRDIGEHSVWKDNDDGNDNDDIDNDDGDDLDNDNDDDDDEDDDVSVGDRRGDVGQHDPDTSQPAISVVRLPPNTSLLFPSLPFFALREKKELERLDQSQCTSNVLY